MDGNRQISVGGQGAILDRVVPETNSTPRPASRGVGNSVGASTVAPGRAASSHTKTPTRGEGEALSLSHNAAGVSTPAPRPVFPLVIAEWDRNKREVIRVALDQYQGRYTINARVWFRDDDDNLRPGKSGMTLSVKHLPAMADALGKALERAIDLGLLEDAGGSQ